VSIGSKEGITKAEVVNGKVISTIGVIPGHFERNGSAEIGYIIKIMSKTIIKKMYTT
jgi:hypothetical protein